MILSKIIWIVWFDKKFNLIIVNIESDGIIRADLMSNARSKRSFVAHLFDYNLGYAQVFRERMLSRAFFVFAHHFHLSCLEWPVLIARTIAKCRKSRRLTWFLFTMEMHRRVWLCIQILIRVERSLRTLTTQSYVARYLVFDASHLVFIRAQLEFGQFWFFTRVVEHSQVANGRSIWRLFVVV